MEKKEKILTNTERLTVRKATLDDSTDIFDWRNDPVSVKFSPTGLVKLEDHLKWYPRKLTDNNCLMLIITNEKKEKIGMARFDRENEKAVVSININPKFRGRGYGYLGLTAAISECFGHYLVEKIEAKVDTDNEISKKLFQKSGFVISGAENSLLIFTLNRKDYFNSKMKFGIKLWSNNDQWFPEAVMRFQNKDFDFIELYVLPNSFSEEHWNILKQANIPINIHAPNEHQLNLAISNEQNLFIMEEVKRAANFFSSEYIIIHPGIGGDIKCILSNIKNINDHRLIIENTPYKSLIGKDHLFGYTFERMRIILEETNKKFCLDFTHAIKSATTQNIDAKEFITKLMTLNPSVFHISDGDSSIEHDQHFNLGEGNFDLKFNKSCVLQCPNAFVVFETPKTNNTLENDIKNINFFKQL